MKLLSNVKLNRGQILILNNLIQHEIEYIDMDVRYETDENYVKELEDYEEQLLVIRKKLMASM